MSEQRQVDTIIEGGLVITMNAERTMYQSGSIAIDRASIVGVGPVDEISAQFPPEILSRPGGAR